jgi:subtilisin family serine protease
MVVAGGNSNADACLTSPASAINAITAVGATVRDDSRASFSNFGTCINIFAPGVGIISARTNTNVRSWSLSGTSMAAPHVAGAAALLLEANLGIPPSEVLAKIILSATAGVVTQLGVGFPNLMLYTGDITGPVPTFAPAPAPAPAPVPAPAPAPAPASPQLRLPSALQNSTHAPKAATAVRTNADAAIIVNHASKMT